MSRQCSVTQMIFRTRAGLTAGFPEPPLGFRTPWGRSVSNRLRMRVSPTLHSSRLRGVSSYGFAVSPFCGNSSAPGTERVEPRGQSLRPNWPGAQGFREHGSLGPRADPRRYGNCLTLRGLDCRERGAICSNGSSQRARECSSASARSALSFRNGSVSKGTLCAHGGAVLPRGVLRPHGRPGRGP